MKIINWICKRFNLTNQRRNSLIKTFICRGKHKWNNGICERCNTKMGY